MSFCNRLKVVRTVVLNPPGGVTTQDTPQYYFACTIEVLDINASGRYFGIGKMFRKNVNLYQRSMNDSVGLSYNLSKEAVVRIHCPV